MAEVRRQYRVLNPVNFVDLSNQLNIILSHIADRLDQMEGYRGTPLFKADLDLGGNTATNSGDAALDTDLIPKEQAETITIPDIAWPIGSIFFGSVSTNPGTLIGIGTWIVVATGQLYIGTGDKGSGLVGSHSSNIENIEEPRVLIYIWKRTA